MRQTILSIFLVVTLLSCSSVRSTTQIKSELYFGLSNEEGAISDRDWEAFKAKQIDQRLGGYTLVDSKGYWTNEAGQTLHEDSKILIYIHPKSDAIESKLDSIIEFYKLEFKQEAVLKTQQKVKAKF